MTNPLSKRGLLLGFALAFAASIAVTFGLLLARKLEYVLVYTLYYFLWTTLFLTGYVLYLEQREKGATLKSLYLDLRSPVALGLLLCTVMFVAVPPDFRILADETNLLGVSLSLYTDKSFYNPLQATYYYDQFTITQKVLPHRPGLWAFLTSLIHSVRGFYDENGFVLNFLAAWATFVALIVLCEKLLDRTYGYAAAAVLAAFPLYALSTTSSGFDTLNLLFLVLIAMRIMMFVLNPTHITLAVLVLVVTLGAQCRYETVLLALPAGLAVLWRLKDLLPDRARDAAPLGDTAPAGSKSRGTASRGSKSGGLRAPGLIACLMPLLFLPILWQRLLSRAIANESDIGKVVPISWRHVPQNFINALDFFFNPMSRDYPSSRIFAWLAVLGIILYIALLLLKKARWTAERRAFLFFAMPAMLLAPLAHFAYYLGDIRFVFNMRYGTAYLAFIAMAAAYPLRLMARSRSGDFFLVFILAAFLFHHLPEASNNMRGKTLFLYREFRETRAFFKRLPRKNFIVVADRPSMYAAHGWGSSYFNNANQNAAGYLNSLRANLYSDIFVIQHVDYTTNKPQEALDERYVLEPVHAFQNTGSDQVRISRVVR